MNIIKRFAAAGLLLLLVGGLCGCGSQEPEPETNADLSVDIAVPFAMVSVAPETEALQEEAIHIDVNGNVSLRNASQVLSDGADTAASSDKRYKTLQVGSSGEDVAKLQYRLQQLEYFTGSISGIFDNDTEKAVRRFERSYGVMQTGIATSAFQLKLYGEDATVYNSDAYIAAVKSHYNTLQSGSVGSDVYALQRRLKELGYPITDLTAVYDEETAEAVRLFALSYGVKEMRVAYISIQEEIYSENALRYRSESGEGASEETNVLEMGDTGTLVMQLQSRLIALGYLNGSATGIYNADTVAAVRLFQKVCGFEVTGSMPYYLQAVLLSDQAQEFAVGNVSINLEIGDEGTLVTSLQNRLITLGYATGTASGVYDENTAASLKLFQTYNNLSPTGSASEDVQRLLYSKEALTYKQALRIMAGDATPEPEAPAETPAPAAAEEPAVVLPWAAPTEVPEILIKPTEAPSIDDFQPDPNGENEGETTDAFTFTMDDIVLEEKQSFKKGDTGTEIRQIQARLKELGYKVKRNGKFDAQTVDAVKDFQSHVGVTQDGQISATMYTYLFSKAAPDTNHVMYRSTQDHTALRYGDSGDDVVHLQQQLVRLGYLLNEDIAGVEGQFENETRTAVIEAQTAMGYENADGVAGAEFQCFIYSEFNSYIKR